jgi:hypothetical protein
VQRRTAQVVLRLVIKRTVLTLLVMFPLSGMLLVLTVIQLMVVLGLVKFFCTEDKFFHCAAKWFAFLGTHVNAPMISLNSRLYSLPKFWLVNRPNPIP